MLLCSVVLLRGSYTTVAFYRFGREMQRKRIARHSSDSENAALDCKQPLKRLQIALHRIIKVAIPLHLELLAKHKENIEKFQSEGQWNLVHSEQVNASRTVQQLKSDIHELETVREQVKPEELDEFECKVQETRTQALDAINSFIEIHSSVTQPFVPNDLDTVSKPSSGIPSPTDRSPTPPIAVLPSDWLQKNETSVYECEEAMEQEQQQLRHEPSQYSLASRSWNTLKTDLLELNALIHKFAQMVLHQQTAVNCIEYNIIEAHEDVQEGTKKLGRAVALKAAMLPVTGAVIGGIVGGPLGLMAGFKLAGVAGALGGGVLGFTGGKFLQKKKTEISDIELQNLSPRIKRSQSVPDIASGNSLKED